MYLDDDSKKQLDALKKGKDQNFAMLAKGSKINWLCIYKRGNASTLIQAAKKSGHKGKPYFGIATNAGGTILFQMARADGFDQTPGKEVHLKKAIEEATKKKYTINYHLIDKLPGAEDTDADVDTNEAPDQVCNKVKKQLNKLKDPIASAIEGDAQLKRPLLTLVKDIQDAIKDTDAEKAVKSYGELKKMVEG